MLGATMRCYILAIVAVLGLLARPANCQTPKRVALHYRQPRLWFTSILSRPSGTRSDLSAYVVYRGQDDEFFQTGHRHIAPLRARRPEPEIYLNASTVAELAVTSGQWVRVVTKQGSAEAKVAICEDMSNSLVRMPHGWWRLSAGTGTLSDALSSAMHN
jgi:anaerobic selenocysteine-containing dehydrogenase